MNEETTLPPVKPSRLRAAWAYAVGWCGRHQVAAAVLAGLLAGLLLPPLMRWYL